MSKLAMPFNNPSTYEGHSGVDFGKPSNTTIYASGPGVVNWSGYVNERAGYGVIVTCDTYPNVEFLYAHQPVNARRPARKARFNKGDSLGAVGSSGRSTGPHLHLEVVNGPGAHTYEGIWLYFDKNNWIGKPDSADGGSKPLPIPNQKIEENKVYIAQVNHGALQGRFFVSPNGAGKSFALGLGQDAKVHGDVPTIEITAFSESFWKTVELV